MIGRAVLVCGGLVLMASGAVLLVGTVPTAAFPNLAAWLALSVLIHDGLVGLAVATTGWAVSRLVPRRYRSYAQTGLVVAGVVIVMAVPVLLGRGRTAANPSLLPQDYPRNLVVVVAVVAVVTALTALVGSRRRSARERQERAA